MVEPGCSNFSEDEDDFFESVVEDGTDHDCILSINEEALDVDVGHDTSNDNDDVIADGSVDPDAANIDLVGIEFQKQFTVGMKFDSHHELRAALDVFANEYGFVFATNGSRFRCNRSGQTRMSAKNKESAVNSTKKREPNNWMKIGCTFGVNWTYTHLPTKQERLQGIKRTIDQVKITSVRAVHDNGCTPGPEQAIHCLRASGGLLKKDVAKLLDAVNLVNSTHVRPNALRQMLKPLLPKNTVPTSQDLVNFRLWARENGSKIQNKFGAVISFGTNDVSRILGGKTLHYKDLMFSQPAIHDSGEILKSVLAQCLEADEGIVLLRFMEQLKVTDRGFDFRAAFAPDGKLTGVVWQTSSMRAAFARYGECLFLDFMKRKLNALNWPYIGPCVIDGYKHVRVVCEGILVSEKKEAYVFVLKSLFEMSGDYRNKECVYAVFADGFFSNDILTAAGIGNTCQFFLDQWHLLKKDWPQYFGRAFSGDLAAALGCMVRASCEEKFEAALNQAKHAVRTNPKFLDYVSKLGRNRSRFSTFAMQNCKGTMMRRGSTHAEQNHSSVLSHIGDHLYEDPAVEVQLLLDRQKELDGALSTEISKYVFISASARVEFEKHSQPYEIGKAKVSLSPWAFDIYEENFAKAVHYKCKPLEGSPDSFSVWHTNCPEKARVVSLPSGCSCTTRVSLLAMCCHEICCRHAQGLSGISSDYFARRWEQVSTVEHLPRPDILNADILGVGNNDGRGSDIHEDNNNQGNTLDDDDDCESNSAHDVNNNGNDAAYEVSGIKQRQTPSYTECMREAGEVCQLAQSGNCSDALLGLMRLLRQYFYNVNAGRQNERSLTDLASLFAQSVDPSFDEIMFQSLPDGGIIRNGCAHGPQDKHSSRKRIKSSHEISSAMSGKTRLPGCGFCSLTTHYQNKCPKKEGIGTEIGDKEIRRLSHHINGLTVTLTQDGASERMLLPSTAHILNDLPVDVRCICYHGVYYKPPDVPDRNPHFCKLRLYGHAGEPLQDYPEAEYFISVDSVATWMIIAATRKTYYVFLARNI